MKKSLNILLVLLITFFTVPFGGITTLAAEKVYDNIKDGEYTVTAKALHADKDESSGAAGFIKEKAIISIQGGKVKFSITVPKNDFAEIKGLQVEGIEPIIEEDDENEYMTYALKNLKSELNAQVQYVVPALGMDHDVPFRFVLEGLDELPVVDEEPETPENSDEDESENGDESDHDSGNENEENEEEPDQSFADLENGSYEIKVSYLKSDDDDTSAMARYLDGTAFVTVKDGEAEVTITVNDHHTVTKLLVDNNKSTVAKLDENKRYETFKLNRLEPVLNANVEYQAPFGDSIHYGKADFRIVFDEENIVEVEAEKQPGHTIEETLLQLDDGFYTIDASYINQKDGSESKMGSYLGKTVFTSYEDGKVLLTITVNDDQTVTSLQVDGQEPVETVVDGDKRYETYELDDLVSLMDAYVEYQVGTFNGNANFIISLDTQSVQTADESDKPEANDEDSNETEVELNQSTPVKSGEVVTIQGDESTQLTMPENLPDDVKVKISSVDVKDQGDLEIAGEVYDFTFENLGNNPGTFELVMGYDQEKYNLDDYTVDIYYFDGDKWIPQNGKVENGKVIAKVNHFSAYGVFAKKLDKSEETDVKVPENAEEIDYVVMHENGEKESTANSFFEKPGLLFEKDGEMYVQVTIKNGDMIQKLRSEHGDAVIVNENGDGSIDVQFKVNADLSDTILNMHVVVPGLYGKEHTTLFVIKQEKENEVEEQTEDSGTPKPNPTPTPEEPTEKDLLTPDKVYKIDYVIKHEDGSKASVANDFFEKPARLLEKDGKKYVQLKITNGEMVKELKNKYGNALLVKENDDGSVVVQLKVNDDLSDMLLDMHVVVPAGTIPGFPGYNEEHQAILAFDKDSIEEFDGDYKLVGTGDKENKNGPFIKDESPKKPEFGDEKNDKDHKKDQKPENNSDEKTENPQTGDTTSILLYSMLLIGSLIPLAIKVRRRFV